MLPSASDRPLFAGLRPDPAVARSRQEQVRSDAVPRSLLRPVELAERAAAIATGHTAGVTGVV